MWELNIYKVEASIINTIVQYITKFGPDHWMAVLTFIAIVITAVTFIKNQKFIRKQQFESTFFNMMKQLEDIVSKLSLVTEDIVPQMYGDLSGNYTKGDKNNGSIIINGRDVFERYYISTYVWITDKDTFEKIYNIDDSRKYLITKIDIFPNREFENKYIQALGVKNIINDLGIIGYENIDNLHFLDHYFRYLYRIIKFVDEAQFLESKTKYIDQRYKYLCILRATLSPYELVFLFYNGLSYNGNKDFKPLIEKYSLLNNLRPELTAESNNEIVENDGKYLVAKKNFDKKHNDYERFHTDIKGDKTKYYWSAFVKDKKLFNHTN